MPTMRRAIAIRHVAFEDLGLLGPVLKAGGWDISYRDAPLDDLSDPAIAGADLLVVLGGPIGVYEADAYPFVTAEIVLLERRLAADRPTLGICLGSQLMAKALGADVYPGPVKEIGWGTVALTEAGRASCLAPLGEAGAQILHWHGDTFGLPAGATRFASNASYPNQAFGFGLNGLALQFHVEADPHALEAWYVGHAAELGAARVSVPQLRAATAAIAPRLRPQAEAIFTPWLAQIAR